MLGKGSFKIPSMMTGIVYAGVGGPEVVRCQEMPVPKLAVGEVLIRVEAAGLNRADIAQRLGHYDPPAGASKVPGLEVSGTVVDANALAGGGAELVGQKVCALLSGGGYAQYVAVPANQVLPVPRALTMDQAGAIMEVACTVISNLKMTVRVRQGQWVLIHGGSGGIGTFALQYLNSIGAHSIATASTEAKCDWALQAGAEYTANYRESDFVEETLRITEGRGVDVILDVVGAKYLASNVRALADGGRLVVIGLQGGARAELNLNELLSKRAGVIATALRSRSAEQKAQVVQATFDTVWPLLETGEIKVHVDRQFPLCEAAEAQRYFDSGEHRGKVVLTTED